MSTLQFKRLPRLAAPRRPGGEVHLEPPPEVPRVIPGGVFMKIMPFLMIGVSAIMVLFMVKAGQATTGIITGGMMLMGSVTMLAGGGGGRGGGAKKAEMNEDRKDYLRYLGQMRKHAREATLEQRDEREWVHPDPQSLWSIATSHRMWERRSADSDFLHLRVGRGSQRLDTRLVPPQAGPVEELKPRIRHTGAAPLRCAPTPSCPTCRCPSRCAASPPSACQGERTALGHARGPHGESRRGSLLAGRQDGGVGIGR